jgi:DNA-binding transcriptional regulator of glucitol operon
MLENTWVLVVGLALTWFLQLYLTSLQMRRYYGRIAALRREGQVWVGLAGSAWRRRTYAVMVVGPDRRVQRVEQLSGWTVLAKLKDVPGVAGYTVEEIADDSVALPVPKKLREALKHAVSLMHAHEQEQQVESSADPDPGTSVVPSSP